MMKEWKDRPEILRNLLNPAFCGEIFRRVIYAYNKNSQNNQFPYELIYLVLPLILHRQTRENMPKTTSTYFYKWVSMNEFLFVDLIKRSRMLLPYCNESIMFLMHQGAIKITDDGKIVLSKYRRKNPVGSCSEELISIYKKSEFLGKWFQLTGTPQTIYMYLKIKP